MYTIDAEEEKKEILKRYRGLLRVYKPKTLKDKKQVRRAFDHGCECTQGYAQEEWRALYLSSDQCGDNRSRGDRAWHDIR